VPDLETKNEVRVSGII